jgi:hypothetical protein
MSLSARTVSLFASVLVALAVAGCESDQPTVTRGPNLKVIAADLRTRPRYSIGGSSVASGRPAPVTGAFDSAAKTGVVRFPVFVDQRVGRAELRLIGKSGFVRRAPIAGATPVGLAAPLVNTTGSTSWLPLPADGSGYAGLLIGSYVPQILVDKLAANPQRWRYAGTKKIGSVPATGYTTKPVGGAGLALKTATLWTTPRSLVRVELENAFGVNVAYTLAPSARAVAVQAPDPKLVQSGAPAVDTPSTPFWPLATGTTAGVTYQVSRAGSRDGGSCWRTTTMPPYDAVIGNGPEHDVCLRNVSGSDDPADQVQFVVDAGQQSYFEMLGVQLPPGATAVLTLGDGTTTPMVPGPTGLALYVGSAAPIAGYLEVTLADGTKLACGPGSVTSASEATGATNGPAGTNTGSDINRQLELRGQPWACLSFEALGQ